ncbi:MAG: PAS domain S-box protein, partial [Proteobacteria bacterium]|nr:PAS domain S-box protein [Pseudomonadota bacterium]
MILIFPVATVIICKLFLDQEARIAIEESFKKSEKQFSLMAENIHEGLTIVEPGNTIFINDRACEITGHTREELQHMKTTDVVTPEYRPLIMEAEGKFWETGTLPEAIEFEIIRKDGSRRFISNSYSASWKDGKVISRYIITNDITERKRAEAAIRESEERFRLANLATFNAIWDWDLQTNSLWWNENFKTLFGYRAEEIEPSIESWTSRIHPEDLSRIETGIHAAIDSGQQYWSDQYRFRRKDGMYAEVEDRGYIDREAGGNPVRMIGAMQDITERKRAEEAVKKSELKYRELFDTMNDGFVITDLKGTILECNTAYAEMLGYEKEELKRLSYQDLTPPKWHAIEEHI